MTTQRQLLDAIIEEPGCDLHRLVYADWLEERDEDAYAGFIRHQLDKGQGRQAILLPRGATYQFGWFHPWGVPSFSRAPFWCDCTMRRGFIESIACTHDDFIAHAGELFALQPITEVRLTDKTPWIADGGEAHWWPSLLPQHPYDIQNHLVPRLTRVSYATKEEAERALSDWCVADGRNRAELYRDPG